jgi:hypothetical protein
VTPLSTPETGSTSFATTSRASDVFSCVVPESFAALGAGGGGTGVAVAVGVGEIDGLGAGGNWIGVGVGMAVAAGGSDNTVTPTVAATGAPAEGTTRYVNVSVPT